MLRAAAILLGALQSLAFILHAFSHDPLPLETNAAEQAGIAQGLQIHIHVMIIIWRLPLNDVVLAEEAADLVLQPDVLVILVDDDCIKIAA